MAEAGGSVVPGPLVFLLHDTYGFPPDLTADIARERGSRSTWRATRARWRRSGSGRGPPAGLASINAGRAMAGRSEFRGYEELESQGRVPGCFAMARGRGGWPQSEQGEVVLDRTPFYAEAGGQIGDSGSCGRRGNAIRGRGHTEARCGAFAHRST